MKILYQIAFVCLIGIRVASGEAAEPPLVRLSFWVPPDHMTEFEAVYSEEIRPILKSYGLVESNERVPFSEIGMFDRLFEVTGLNLSQKWQALQKDATLQAIIQKLRIDFGENYQTFLEKTMPERVPSGHYRPVESLHSDLAKEIAAILSDRQPSPVKVDIAFLDQLSFQDFTQWLSQPSCSFGFNFVPGGQGLIDFSFPVANNLIDQKMGRVPQTAPKARTLTPSERDMMKGIAAQLLNRLEHVWEKWQKVHISTPTMMTNPALMDMAKPGQLVMLVAFEVQHENHVGDGMINFCYPITALGSALSFQYQLYWYSRPASVDRVVPAEPGRQARDVTSRGHWLSYEASSGLKSSLTTGGNVSVFSICTSQEGTLWLGTSDGVRKFNGQSWSIYRQELPHNAVLSTFQDREGNLWFGTEKGLCRYTPSASSKQAAWTTLTTSQGLIHNEVNAIYQDRKGIFWFGTPKGISRFDGQIWTTFTSQDGLADDHVFSILEDQEGRIWVGTRNGLRQYANGTWKTIKTQNGLTDARIFAIYQDLKGRVWLGTENGIVCYDGQSFALKDHRSALSIFEDTHGDLWFGTPQGILRYDSQTFVDLSVESGLENHQVLAIAPDREGHLWFGTDRGLVRYDPQSFTTFTFQNGQASNRVYDTVIDKKGHLWVTTEGGLHQFDGTNWTVFAPKDSLTDQAMRNILEDADGHMWFSMRSRGLTRYDGNTWTTFKYGDESSVEGFPRFEDVNGHLWFDNGRPFQYDGNSIFSMTSERWFSKDRDSHIWFILPTGVVRFDGATYHYFRGDEVSANKAVHKIYKDSKGRVWFGLEDGLSRYDGSKFVHFTPEDGLVKGRIVSIMEDQEKHLWFAAREGITRYDGQIFTTFSKADGLASNSVSWIFQDQQGHLWFTHPDKGLSRYDGKVFVTYTKNDGLLDDRVRTIHQDSEGSFWLQFDHGLTRFRPPKPIPLVPSITVVTHKQHRSGISAFSLSSNEAQVSFELTTMSFKTRPEEVVYRYRLKGYEDRWQNTQTQRVEYQNLPLGKYRFEVYAIDRDLVYSEHPAVVSFSVYPPNTTLALVGGLGLAVIALGLVSVYAIRRRRDLHRAEQALMRELEEELQTARKLQMGLMPTSSPQIEGLDIAGRCITATHVGGDFFQYFHRSEGKLAFTLADVTGHAMNAAIPVVMFSGILKSEMQHGHQIEQLFQTLNRTLHESLEARTFICFEMGELDLTSRMLRLSNSGCPYPYHFKAATGEVVELQVNAYPLGVRPDTLFGVVETQLESGDYVIFCSDGIVEAENGEGELFGYERMVETIREACVEEVSAEATIDRLLSVVSAFKGDAPQSDDMTCVIVRINGSAVWPISASAT